MLSGVINLNKSSEMSSNKALCILKKTLFQNNIITKIGHFGTLDPIAEGVLPVALGRATRLFDYTLDKIKIYRATFAFGVETDTLDRTGKVVRQDEKTVSEEELVAVCSRIGGYVLQTPPLYSAKSGGGVRAYDLARKGLDFELSPKKVYIESVKVLSQYAPNEFELEIVCGGGTYIRSIARDVAAELGTVGIMTSLVRTASGPFTIENSVTLEELSENPYSCILPMDIFLRDFPCVEVSRQQTQLMLNGLEISLNEADIKEKNVLVCVRDEDGIAGIAVNNGNLLKMKTWLK